MLDRLCTLDDMARVPSVRPLIDGLLYRDTVAQLSGPPGSYKTFLTVGMACAVAAGVGWEGHRVSQPGMVVYVAPEGASGLRLRILAWCERNGVPVDQVSRNLRILDGPVLLGETLDVSDAVAAAKALGSVLTVLDTRARCTLGLDENSATEQGRAIEAVDAIRRASNGTVLLVHHSGRDGGAGRGSNAWDGAVWTDLRVKGAGQRGTITCSKQKEIADGCTHPFRLESVTVSEQAMPRWTDESGELVSDEAWTTGRSTLVAVRTERAGNGPEDTRSVRVVLDVFRTNGSEQGLTLAEALPLAESAGCCRSSFYTAARTLIARVSLLNVGTTRRPRYVVAEPVGPADE